MNATQTVEAHSIQAYRMRKGANRPLLIEKGFHPFVSPAANSALQSCAVPLAVEPSSYELTRRYLEQNELPPPIACGRRNSWLPLITTFPSRRAVALV